MLKKIHIDQLRKGMYIQELCGSWMEHPFWRSSFLLTEKKDFQKILDSSITELWIDTAKGADVQAGEQAISEEQAQAEVNKKIQQLADTSHNKTIQPVAIDEELNRAAKICTRSKEAVVSMFQEARLGNAIDAHNAQALVEEIYESVNRHSAALLSLARLKTADDYTYMHSVAVCALMIALARQLNLSEHEVHQAGMAGLLHDLGKAFTPNEVLNKPGKLTDEEFAIMKSHPSKGYHILKETPSIDDVALDVCLHHHEKINGSGYPEGLSGEMISQFAKMGAVCDVYDAITSNRPYKSGWDPAESIRKMAEWTEGHFDPQIFQHFVKSIGIYPTGSLVRLDSEKLGVVIEQTQHSLLTPKVKVFYSIKSGTRIAPKVLDLSSDQCSDKIRGRENPADWDFPDLIELWSAGL